MHFWHQHGAGHHRIAELAQLQGQVDRADVIGEQASAGPGAMADFLNLAEEFAHMVDLVLRQVLPLEASPDLRRLALPNEIEGLVEALHGLVVPTATDRRQAGSVRAIIRVVEDSNARAGGRKHGWSPSGIALSHTNLTNQIQMFKSLKMVVQPGGR